MIRLVSCTKQQKTGECLPHDLFMESPLFQKARQYCENKQGEWYVLSAKYGLLHPSKHEIAPYEKRLNDINAEQRREWSRTVFNQLQDRNLLDETLVFHTGKAYYENLLPLLDEVDAYYLLPLKGLGYPQQLAWYNNHLNN